MTCAHYEVDSGRIDIGWTDPEDGRYVLRLKTAGPEDRTLFFGGHPRGSAEVTLERFGLTGGETLVGRFTEYGTNGRYVSDPYEFTIDLSAVDFSALQPGGYGIGGRYPCTFADSVLPRKSPGRDA